MIGAVLKLIIFTSMVNRIINTSRNERVTQQVQDTYTDTNTYTVYDTYTDTYTVYDTYTDTYTVYDTDTDTVYGTDTVYDIYRYIYSL